MRELRVQRRDALEHRGEQGDRVHAVLRVGAGGFHAVALDLVPGEARRARSPRRGRCTRRGCRRPAGAAPGAPRRRRSPTPRRSRRQRSRSPRRRAPPASSASAARSIAAKPDFMSAAPRPYMRPSRTTGSNASGPHGPTTSRCPRSMRLGPPPDAGEPADDVGPAGEHVPQRRPRCRDLRGAGRGTRRTPPRPARPPDPGSCCRCAPSRRAGLRAPTCVPPRVCSWPGTKRRFFL